MLAITLPSIPPYLLQPCGHPVDWYACCMALTGAKHEITDLIVDRFVLPLVSCHALDSFEDPAPVFADEAVVLNIKLREERPDLDRFPSSPSNADARLGRLACSRCF